MKRKTKIQSHRCFDCANAYLMRSHPFNPVISECTVTGQREVASMLLKCQNFKQKTEQQIIHPMKFLK